MFEEFDEEVQEAEAAEAAAAQGGAAQQDKDSELRPQHHKQRTHGAEGGAGEGDDDDDDDEVRLVRRKGGKMRRWSHAAQACCFEVVRGARTPLFKPKSWICRTLRCRPFRAGTCASAAQPAWTACRWSMVMSCCLCSCPSWSSGCRWVVLGSAAVVGLAFLGKGGLREGGLCSKRSV